jgi:DNA-binding ferritin-like protein (Dps family)
MAFCSIPALSGLTIHQDEEDSERKWTLLDDFLSFLRKHHRPSDALREIKKFNIQKEFKAHKNGLKEINGQLTVNMRSVLKYFFNHSESLYICQKVVEQIEKRCFYKNSSSEKTIKDIYSAIVKTVYRNSSIEKHILAN